MPGHGRALSYEQDVGSWLPKLFGRRRAPAAKSSLTMDNIEVATAVVKADSLEEVFAAVRDGLQKVRATGAALLHHALDVGDLLNIAQEQIKWTGGSWKRALREHCFLSVRSAFVYQQLARHRTRSKRLFSTPANSAYGRPCG